jgi:uncharacterized protein YndB with AHSA1/START domain
MNREDNTAVESANNEFLMTQIFDAPRELVFNAWTERERLMQWWRPKGFTMHTCNLDPSPGGVFHYGSRGPEPNHRPAGGVSDGDVNAGLVGSICRDQWRVNISLTD